MRVLRAQEEPLPELPGYPFAPHFVRIPTPGETPVDMHYVDEGPPGGRPVVLLHGNPTWSYAYRKMIPKLASAGHRVLAPDLIGLGRSDKPTELEAYSIERHIGWLRAWFDAMALEGALLVCQDWGGMFGLSIASSDPSPFSGVVVANTGLYYDGHEMAEDEIAQVEAWTEFTRTTPDLPLGPTLESLLATKLSPEELDAYASPYPTPEHKAGLRSFPMFIPPQTTAEGCMVESMRTWERLEKFETPTLVAFSDQDRLTGPFAERFVARVPGARGQAHTTIRGARHVVQDDAADELAALVLEFAARLAA